MKEQNILFRGSATEDTNNGPVECLGKIYANDEARRDYFLGLLREKLQDPEFRKIEGFPIGTDEDILALSDPPYYTACPNPFLGDFIKFHGKPYDPSIPYSREPFAVDVSEGKSDPIYKAHSYHTKVPHLAIVPSILHYTKPGDTVLDGFCGSGMTGIAAQWCGCAPDEYKRIVEADFAKQGLARPEWGSRFAILNDLSPAATFIAANYNLPFDVLEFARAAQQLLDEVEQENGWMYETKHSDGKSVGHIEYTVWSEVFTCPDCTGEIVFLDEAMNDEKRVKDTFACPHCRADVTKDSLQRVFETLVDPANGKPWKRIKYRASLISYIYNGERYEKKIDSYDADVLERIAALPLPVEVPTTRFPIEQMYHGSRIEPKGFCNIHHFFMPRAVHSMSALWRKANTQKDARVRHMLLFFVEQGITTLSVLNRYRGNQTSQSNQVLTGVYYIPSQIAEISVNYRYRSKLKSITKAFDTETTRQMDTLIATATAARLSLETNTIDYIFTDPPFGENIFYADLNFLVETWYRVITNTMTEAIVDKRKMKGLLEYQQLMQQCFQEYYRVLKPGRWMTVVFHNSRNAVWNAIQESMQAAGFVVADVRTLDKQQGSYRQVTSTAVKQDLVISAYKPDSGLEGRFELEAGTEAGVWDFVRSHLKQLPVFVAKDSQAEVIAERQSSWLFDRMVAFHVQRGVMVPLSTSEFYAGLMQRFSVRDGMYFLPEQVAEYDKKRMTVKELMQLQLFVSDEASAIQWLKQQIVQKPQTFQELHPQFLKELGGWQKHEMPIELSEVLSQNFLYYDGKGEVPSQIHGYLSTNFKDLRNLPKDDANLRIKAKDRWYVPDPNKASDLEKLREKSLLKEFQEYRISNQRKLKVFRVEAIRAGFKKAWQERDYDTVIAIAQKIPESVLQEDPKLLMWYDQALTRKGEK